MSARTERLRLATQAEAPSTLSARLAYDYRHQVWIVDGRYQDCGHPEAMRCGCFARHHRDGAEVGLRGFAPCRRHAPPCSTHLHGG